MSVSADPLREPEEAPPFPKDLSTVPACLSCASAPINQPVGLVCRVDTVYEVEVLGDDAVHQRLRLCDFHGSLLDTFPVPQGQLTERALKALNKGMLVVAYGCFEVDHDGRRRRGAKGPGTRLRVHAIEALPRISYLLGPTQDDLSQIDARLDALFAAGPDALKDHAIKELNDQTDTLSAGQSRRFADAQLMLILQALSFGMVSKGTNPRISTWFLSSPGAGKKKLSSQARTAAIVSDLAQPGCTSQAGLTATVQQVAGRGWQAKAGKLPRTSYGVFVAEDLHRVSAKDMRAMQAAFMGVAEDGLCAATKAASQNFICLTALHLNANRKSILEGNKEIQSPQGRAEDLIANFDLLTRIDGIIDLTSGDDASRSSEDMVTQEDEEDEDPFEERADRRTWELKLLFARLVDRIRKVSLEDVVDEARQLIADITLLVREYTAQLTGPEQEIFHGDALLRRIANSVKKFVGASARLHGRDRATPEDLDCAWRMINYKLEVVKYACGRLERIQPLGSRDRQVRKALRLKEKRWKQIVESWGGMEGVSAEDIANTQGCSLKTVQLELRSRGLFPKTGRYSIPTWSEWKVLEKELDNLDPDELREGEDEEPEDDDDEDDDDEAAAEADQAALDDCLPELPEKVDPVIDAINEVAASEELRPQRQFISSSLFQLAFDQDGQMGDYRYAASAAWNFITSLHRELHQEDGQKIGAEAEREVMGRLFHPEWIVRAPQALALYVESELPDESSMIRRELEAKRDTLPPEIVAAAEAVLKRLAHFRAKWLAQVEADRQARMEAYHNGPYH